MLLFQLLFKNLHTFLVNPRQREFYWLLLLYGRTKRFSLKKIKFQSFIFEVPDCASFLWQFKEIFADEIYKFKSKTLTPVIFDCGANVGTSCLYFKTLYPLAQITAFEADPNMAATLDKNMKVNQISDVVVVPKAIWTHNDGIVMNLDGSDGGSIILKGTAQMSVPSVRLKDLIEQTPIIDFLKIDIEGAETEVIDDCKEVLWKVSHIFVEYHSYFGSLQSLGTILDILTNNGFRYYLVPVNVRHTPFVNKGKSKLMDFQTNIFAYKE